MWRNRPKILLEGHKSIAIININTYPLIRNDVRCIDTKWCTLGWWKLISHDTHVYNAFKVSHDHILGNHLKATSVPVGCTGTVPLIYLYYSCRVCINPRPITMGYAIPYSYSSLQQVPILSNTFRIPILDTPGPLSRESTWSILNMAHQTPSVFE